MPNESIADSVDQYFRIGLGGRILVGEIVIRRTNKGFVLCHRDDEAREDAETFREPENAIEISRSDDAGDYRPLKTAPNLRHGWQLEVSNAGEVRRALNYFYPGRLAIFAAWKENRLRTTPLRQTLERQSGMYRVAAKVTDAQIEEVVGNFCRTEDGCLRRIRWKRDSLGKVPSTKLPPEKFEAHSTHEQIPLLCQEACNLLVNECRKAAKGENQ